MFAQSFPPMDFTAIGVLTVIGVFGALIVVPIVMICSFHRYKQRQAAAELVRDMMAQGMSAPDIERILMVWTADPESVTKIYRRRSKEEEQQLKGLPGKGAKNLPLPMKPPIAV